MTVLKTIEMEKNRLKY